MVDSGDDDPAVALGRLRRPAAGGDASPHRDEEQEFLHHAHLRALRQGGVDRQHHVDRSAPAEAGPDVAERVLGAAVTAAVPRRGQKPGAPVTWPPIPLPRWSDHPSLPSIDGTTPALAHRARSTRRTVLLGAAHRFAARGYHGTSVPDILAEAGSDRGEPITEGALHVHFSSRHELARCLITEMLTAWADVTDAVGEQGLDPLWSVLASCDAGIALSMHDPVARGAWRIRPDDAAFTDAFAALEHAELEHLTWLLHDAREQGLLRVPADPAWTAEHLHTVLSGHRTLCENRAEDATGPDLWARMTATWQAVLPAIAAPDWLVGWRASGWARRPGPDPAAYRRARRPEPEAEPPQAS